MSRTSDARERLVQAAIDLLWASSYGAVGVDAICEAASVSKGSFYHFFGSKDELVVAALEHRWQSVMHRMDETFSASRPPLERLHRYLVDTYSRQVDLRRKGGRVLGCFHNSLGAACIDRDPSVVAKIREMNDRMRGYLTSTLRDAQADGSVRAGDPVADARALFGLVQGTLLQARINDDPEMLRELPATGFALLGIRHSQPEPSSRRKTARRKNIVA